MKYWVIWMIAGVVAILAGILALANPFAASIAAVFMTGWGFAFIGGLQVVGAFATDSTRYRLWTLLIGALGVGLGIWIISRPIEALLALTFVVGWLFLAMGIIKVVAAWPLREGDGVRYFWPVLLSGFLSGMLGMMILGGMPGVSEYLLGVFLAVELISTGITAIALSLGLRRRT